MSNFPPTIAKLNKQSTEAQIIEEVRVILVSRNDIKNISIFKAFENKGGRNFLIDLNNSSNVHQIIELLGGDSSNCRGFGSSSVLLRIPDHNQN